MTPWSPLTDAGPVTVRPCGTVANNHGLPARAHRYSTEIAIAALGARGVRTRAEGEEMPVTRANEDPTVPCRGHGEFGGGPNWSAPQQRKHSLVGMAS